MTRGRIRIVGTGRAGRAFELALRDADWIVDTVSHSRLTEESAASGGLAASFGDVEGVDLVLLCVPDRAVAEIARSIPASDSLVVAHCSGSLNLAALDPASRRASIHPLVPLAEPESSARLLRGAYFAVAGDPIGAAIVRSLDGEAIVVDESQRALHHAAAVIASNHVVALLAQVEALAEQVGVPPAAYLQLTRLAVDNVAEFGAQAALTGPVSRGDWQTVARHLEALPEPEREAYLALARRASRLAGRDFPDVG